MNNDAVSLGIHFWASEVLPWVPEPQHEKEIENLQKEERRKKERYFLYFFIFLYFIIFGSGNQGSEVSAAFPK